MGGSFSQDPLRKLPETFPEDEKLTGLTNLGNTCFINSVLQALYACPPFRNELLDLVPLAGPNGLRALSPSRSDVGDVDRDAHLVNGNRQSPYSSPSRHSNASSTSRLAAPGSIIGELARLFALMSSGDERAAFCQPRAFVGAIRRENLLFRTPDHHDAHEFLNFTLNSVITALQKAERARAKPLVGSVGGKPGSPDASAPPVEPASSLMTPSAHGAPVESHKETDKPRQADIRTWVHGLFEGVLVNRTRCVRCETVSTHEEKFLDLSLDVDDAESVIDSIGRYGDEVWLGGSDKYLCDSCSLHQEAFKSTDIKSLPAILTLHLKRFRYDERTQSLRKLRTRVEFPFRLNMSADQDPDAPPTTYELFAVVSHIGDSMRYGHYIAMVRVFDQWFEFDDQRVDVITEARVKQCYGSTGYLSSSPDGYLFMYSQVAPRTAAPSAAGESAVASAVAAAAAKVADGNRGTLAAAGLPVPQSRMMGASNGEPPLTMGAGVRAGAPLDRRSHKSRRRETPEAYAATGR